MNTNSFVIPFLLMLILINFLPSTSYPTSVEQSDTTHKLSISFNTQTRFFELYDINMGKLLSKGIISLKSGRKYISTDNPDIDYFIVENKVGFLSIQFDKTFLINAIISNDSEIIITAEDSTNNSIQFTASAPLSDRTIACILTNEQINDRHALVQTLGVSHIQGAASIYDPLKDLAIQVTSDGIVNWDLFDQWRFKSSANSGQTLCKIKLFRNYYRETLGIKYYVPVKKQSYFKKAPALAMAWIGIEGKFNRPDFAQRKEWLYPNIDWVSKNLLPYAEEMVFQLDDNYPINDPQYMRDISDYIRSNGMIPGIWLAPFGVAPAKEEKKHPEWFIHKPDGSAITTFSGLSYDDIKHYSSTVLNVNNEEAVNKWFAGFLNQINSQWNYDYYKIDGIPAILKVYDQSIDGGGVDGVRKGLQIIRSVIGPDKYINTSWGVPVPLEGMDIVNGSRVGDDTEQLNQVISRVAVAQNYLNNVAWYCDPDGAANMYASTLARSRLNFQSRTLLGQLFVTDDNWTKVPDEILYIWQRTLPTIDSYPVNLYPISNPKEYDHFILKIKKSWGTWDIVGLNNYENRPRQMTLDLGRLPLSSEQVYIYDFWNQKYLGRYARDAKIVQYMQAIDSHCFSVVPVQNDRPVLLSTSRHITQGGIDIANMTVEKENDFWIISGESHHLVKNDPYDMIFMTNGFSISETSVQNGSVTILNKSGIARIRILPNQSEITWKFTFIPDENISIMFDAELVHLIPGQPLDVPVIIRNGKSIQWEIVSSDKNIRLKRNIHRSNVEIDVDKAVLKWDSTWTGSITLQSKDANVLTKKLVLEVQGPARENIANLAKASASTVYFFGDQNGYGRAKGANDMRTFTAWEAAEGETEGWLELTWKEPVEFQRIVIDEWQESFGEIKSWTLEVGYKKYEYTPRNQSKSIVTYQPVTETLEVIKKGQSIGRNYVIELNKPVTANVLRLSIHKATQRPGIWEIEVYPPTRKF